MRSEHAQDSQQFSRWRRYLWPIQREECKKLLPMLLIFFFISLDYNILRTLKDTLLVTAKGSGAEVIPFVKVWAMFPGALLMTFLFGWLSNRFKMETVFYILISFFLAYFAVFAFVLYPLRDLLHPDALADQLAVWLPPGFKGLIAIIRYWTFTIFYVMSELWSSTILSLLFWGFANQVTKLNEAKRFYGLFGVGANFSGIFAGQISIYCCQRYTTSGPLFMIAENQWHQSLILMVSCILLSGCAAIALFRWLNHSVLSEKRYYDPEGIKTEGEVKGKLSLKESLRVLFRSRYLLSIAIVVVAYNLVINLTEVLWKHQVRELYPDPTDYTLYMNHIVSIIGVVATLSSLFVSGNAIRRFGWTFTALLTPMILLITSVCFFLFFFVNRSAPHSFAEWISVSPLIIVVFVGSLQNVLSRGAKYSVFDATKEMAFVPLCPETKLVGKAAIDGVCSRFGKSGGAFIYQTLLLFFSTLTASAPYVACVLLGALVVWTFAVKDLGLQFAQLSDPAAAPHRGHQDAPITGNTAAIDLN